MRKFKFDYDSGNDDLFLFRSDSKSKGGVEIGGKIVLDFNGNRELVGIEILDASEMLSELANVRQEFAPVLKSLKECRVDVHEKAGVTIIKMLFVSGKSEEVPTMLTIPSISKHK
ncbi:MAG: DUF2283 domain-containing protein [archaeon]